MVGGSVQCLRLVRPAEVVVPVVVGSCHPVEFEVVERPVMVRASVVLREATRHRVV